MLIDLALFIFCLLTSMHATFPLSLCSSLQPVHHTFFPISLASLASFFPFPMRHGRFFRSFTPFLFSQVQFDSFFHVPPLPSPLVG